MSISGNIPKSQPQDYLNLIPCGSDKNGQKASHNIKVLQKRGLSEKKKES